MANKYKFSADEKDILKVAKLNQQKSQALKKEMKDLASLWHEQNEADEKYIKELEQKLGIDYNPDKEAPREFIRESPHAVPLYWDDLAAEANKEINYDVSFEDLLSQEEFESAYRHLDEINAEFLEKTGLKKKDIAFFTVALALQCVRQYVLDPWLNKQRAGASQYDEKGRKNNIQAGWYYVATDKILTNRVPFDAQHYAAFSTIRGFLKGGDHRLMTLGHDPVLGWIFGTANIMTGTLTRADFKSAHVKCINGENKIYSLADTGRIFYEVGDRVSHEGTDGKIALGCALLREGIHLKSDVNTKRGLPLPGLGVISVELGNELAEYGIDTASVGAEITLASLINMIIAMIHRLTFDGAEDEKKFYEVRTRKIILYSNFIASTSNVIATAVTKDAKILDVGGLITTLARLVTDTKFICRVKDEFVQSKLDEHFEGIKAETDMLYSSRFSMGIAE